MMLVDSNIIIYAALPEHEDLRRLIAEQAPAVSAASYVHPRGARAGGNSASPARRRRRI
jgi:hypothetical protein